MSLLSQYPDLHFLPIEGDGVLFLQGSRRLWYLNHSAAFIWQQLTETSDRQTIATSLTKTWGISDSQALYDVNNFLTFLENEPFNNNQHHCSEKLNSLEVSQKDDFPVQKWQTRRTYTIHNHLFHFSSTRPPATCPCSNQLNTLFSQQKKRTKHHQEISLWIMPSPQTEGAGWDIIANRKKIIKNTPENMILPQLLGTIFSVLSGTLRDKLLLHSAVITGNNRALLLPGKAGSGKTTLAAIMAKKGWLLYSDELAIIDPLTLHLTPFPIPLSVKSGSLPILSSYYPDLASLKEYLRPDGKKVRYLPIPTIDATKEQAFPTAIIFPLFSSASTTRLKTISRGEALQRLVTTVSSDRELQIDDIKTLIILVTTTPCFTLKFNEPMNAIALMEEPKLTICAQHNEAM